MAERSKSHTVYRSDAWVTTHVTHPDSLTYLTRDPLSAVIQIVMYNSRPLISCKWHQSVKTLKVICNGFSQN